MRNYDLEVRQRWGATEAYKQCAEKTANYKEDKLHAVNDGLMALFAQFSRCMRAGHGPESDEAQALVKQLQAYITENYYSCTSQILAGLGQMYVTDQRFKANIDKNGGGTAEFVLAAIEKYCK